jgi:hypothetical protein
MDAPGTLGSVFAAGSGRPAIFDPLYSGVASFAMAADGVDASSSSMPDVEPGSEVALPSVPLVEPRNGGLGRNGRRAVASGGG